MGVRAIWPCAGRCGAAPASRSVLPLNCHLDNDAFTAQDTYRRNDISALELGAFEIASTCV